MDHIQAHDARTVKTHHQRVKSDHEETVRIAEHQVSLTSAMVKAINAAFSDQGYRRFSIEHASEATCPYPHLADALDACPVLASYLRVDTAMREQAERAERERAEITARHAEAQAATEAGQQAFSARMQARRGR
jgi:hypothetical protein